MFARRLQGKYHIQKFIYLYIVFWNYYFLVILSLVQERMTVEIAKALAEAVSPRGVGVVIEATHMCMVMRGVQKLNSKTVTSHMLGEFRADPKTRQEFLSLIKWWSQFYRLNSILIILKFYSNNNFLSSQLYVCL